MNTTLASVSSVLLATLTTLAGCAVPVSNGTDEATVSSGLAIQSATPTETTAAAVQFSTTNDADEKVYPTDRVTTVDAASATKVFVWVYMGDVPAGNHAAWVYVSNSGGTIVDTFPIAFSTTKPAAGTTITEAGWSPPLDVAFARPSEMETGAGTIVGYETRTNFQLSDLKVKKTLPLGRYTVTVAGDDVSFAGSATFALVNSG